MRNAPEQADATAKYFAEINEIDLIPHEELMELIDRAQAGDDKARSQVAEANQKLVVKIARQYLRVAGQLTLLELVQEGNIGLLETIDRFDTARNIRFSTYASQWIRHFIVAAVSDKSRTIALKRAGYRQVSAARKQRKALTESLGRDPSEDELKERLLGGGSRPKTVEETLTADRMKMAPLNGTGAPDELTLEGRLADPKVLDMEDYIDAKRAPNIHEILQNLPPRERMVLLLRFSEGLTLPEIGTKLSLSRERVRQLQERALEKLRKRLGRTLAEFLEVYEYREAC